MRGPVFVFPAAPPAWDRDGISLIRIVDPLGAAIAWFAPDFGATCVGYNVRRGGEWLEVFGIADGDAAPNWPWPVGCGVVGSIGSPAADPTERADAPTRPRVWQFVERDPTAVVFETTLTESRPTVLADENNALRLRLAASLRDATLSLCLDVYNEGETTISASLGLQTVLPGVSTLGAWHSLHVGNYEISVDKMLCSQMSPSPEGPVTLVLGSGPAHSEDAALVGKDASSKLIMEQNVGIHTVSLSNTANGENLVATLGAASPGESSMTLQPQSQYRVATAFSLRVG